VPKVVDEEKDWAKEFKSDSFDLIISNMHLHWVNDLERTLQGFSETLQADGLFMGSMVGGDSLQELRICLSLAESEREGGVSPLGSPMLSITDVGNILAKGAKFNMPTIDVTHTQHEFVGTWQLLHFLR
jgi:NADH dehydrogenase [ubiquinone] 1 alpha subcomplex assembly factor 5